MQRVFWKQLKKVSMLILMRLFQLLIMLRKLPLGLMKNYNYLVIQYVQHTLLGIKVQLGKYMRKKMYHQLSLAL